MSTVQKTYYRGVLERNKTAMLRALAHANFNMLSMQLRKCCDHPFLISAQVEEEVMAGTESPQQRAERFIRASGKTILLMKLLEKFRREGRKTLLFSQFVTMLELLLPFLEQQGFRCELLTGSQSSTARHQAISRFTQQESDIFLISTKAGGVGINLVAASEIVIFDSDWNPQNDIQATARAHRIGQKQAVNVYRLITANSYEAEMFQHSSRKLGLDKAVFSGDTFKASGDFNEAEKQLSKEEIEMLLKRGIIGFLDSQHSGEDFFNQTIEDILEKNARKVEYAVPQSATTFSKTKFRGE
jgi:chromodomain-helicase-DNA-binding protein 7